MSRDGSVFVFTVTRASSPKRCRMLQEMLTTGRKTAGMKAYWYMHASGVGERGRAVIEAAEASGLIDEAVFTKDNVGQHVAWNRAFEHAKAQGCEYFLRIDDDCEFITKRWLKKLVEASAVLGDRFILSPMIRGLKNPPTRSNKVTVKGYDLWFLRAAIGGICRLHPIELLDSDPPFVADVRKPLGAGDATGIAAWAKERVIPFAYLNSVRVRHATARQEAEDAEHFGRHGVYQYVPYIPDAEAEQDSA